MLSSDEKVRAEAAGDDAEETMLWWRSCVKRRERKGCWRKSSR